MTILGNVLSTAQNAKGQDTAKTTMGGQGGAPDVMHVRPNQAIPIVFVPGIMGSVVLAKPGSNSQRIADNNMDTDKFAWLPDSVGWMKDYWDMSYGLRRRLLTPEETLPAKRPSDADRETVADFVKKHPILSLEEALARGWGSVMITSYGEILARLEAQLQFIYWNKKPVPGIERTQPKAPSTWGELKGYKKLTDDQLKKASNWRFPVYAVGYNWTDCNGEAAAYLSQRIDEILQDCRQRLKLKCEKVILVTHSMGGLVGRKCAQIAPSKIIGVVHGVQPAIGAGAAYRRVRSGWESPGWGIADIISAKMLGATGAEVMAVFANGAGPLELLPNQLYGPDWLKAVWRKNGDTPLFSLPKTDPYSEIYARGDTWWRLIHPAIAQGVIQTDDLPADVQNDSASAAIAWGKYRKRLNQAQKFHAELGDYYHPQSYVHYGADPKKKTWKNVTWVLEDSGTANFSGAVKPLPPVGSQASTYELLRDSLQNNLFLINKATAGDVLVNINGTGVIKKHNGDIFRAYIDNGDDPGDGTVPGHSGNAPLVKAVFGARMTGFGHQDSYSNLNVLAVTLYSIIHLSQGASDLG